MHQDIMDVNMCCCAQRRRILEIGVGLLKLDWLQLGRYLQSLLSQGSQPGASMMLGFRDSWPLYHTLTYTDEMQQVTLPCLC